METLDQRLNAFRGDLADTALRGRVSAERFVRGEPGQIAAAVADLHSAPDASAGVDTQILLGERVTVFETERGWAWVKSHADGYVGYIRTSALAPGVSRTTHRVATLRTFVYMLPDMKSRVLDCLSIASQVTVIAERETRGKLYALLDSGGAVVADHLEPLPADTDAGRQRDFVALAERFVETPYLWGGRSAFGLDCSGLVQLSLMMSGHAAPRDADMQAIALGRAIEPDALQRGDLVFWDGHVAIMTDAATLIHANGATMSVAREPFDDAVERIASLYGRPISYRRLS